MEIETMEDLPSLYGMESRGKKFITACGFKGELLNWSDETVKAFIEGASVRNELRPDCKLLEIGRFIDETDFIDWLNRFSLDPYNDKPWPGDIVRFKPGMWYAVDPCPDYGPTRDHTARIQNIGDFWGYTEAVHVCAGRGSAHHALNGGYSISGGPFRTLDFNALKPTDEIIETNCWNWGSNGPGGGHGVYFTQKVKVWEVESVEIKSLNDNDWDEWVKKGLWCRERWEQ